MLRNMSFNRWNAAAITNPIIECGESRAVWAPSVEQDAAVGNAVPSSAGGK
jgi:hypothetical protein